MECPFDEISQEFVHLPERLYIDTFGFRQNNNADLLCYHRAYHFHLMID